MLELYDYLDSGNGYKIRLLLAQLALPYRHVELDIMRGADPHARSSWRSIPTGAFRCSDWAMAST